MATIHHSKSKGREMHKEKKDILTSKGKKEVDRDDVMQDGDAEAGVDPHVEKINDMPSDPNDRPREIVKDKHKEKKGAP